MVKIGLLVLKTGGVPILNWNTVNIKFSLFVLVKRKYFWTTFIILQNTLPNILLLSFPKAYYNQCMNWFHQRESSFTRKKHEIRKLRKMIPPKKWDQTAHSLLHWIHWMDVEFMMYLFNSWFHSTWNSSFWQKNFQLSYRV